MKRNLQFVHSESTDASRQARDDFDTWRHKRPAPKLVLLRGAQAGRAALAIPLFADVDALADVLLDEAKER